MRTVWIAGVIGLLSSACGGSAPAPEEPKAGKGRKGGKKAEAAAPAKPLDDALRAAPNVLVIVWDTVRADRMSLYGYGKPTTPKLDAWAVRAAVHSRAVSPGVWTLPSHASLFTGLPERGHGVNADHNWLDNDHLTIAEALSAAGYDTYTFCANPYLAKDTNLLQGFTTQEFPWSPTWRKAVEAHMRDKLIAEDASTPVSPKYAGKGGAMANKYVFKEAGPVAADALGAWIDGRPEKDRPFFAFVNLMEAHLPRIPRMESRKAVMTDAEITHSYGVVQSTGHFHEWMGGVRPYSAADLAAISGVYDASLIDVDAATERIFKLLDDKGLTNDTLIVLTSDHGENLGDHELLLHKYSVHNSLSRVPLVVAGPGVSPGRYDAPVSVADGMMRALQGAGVPLDEAAKTKLAARETPFGVVVEYSATADGSIDKLKKSHPNADLSRLERTWTAIEYGPWKYLQGSGGVEELYRVVEDPAEAKNLAETEAEARAEMAKRLEDWTMATPAWEVRDEGGHRRDGELKEGLEALGYVE